LENHSQNFFHSKQIKINHLKNEVINKSKPRNPPNSGNLSSLTFLSGKFPIPFHPTASALCVPTNQPEQKTNMSNTTENDQVKQKLLDLFDEVLTHDGFGEIRVEMKILKRKQKEVILHCGKQYRFVIDTPVLQEQ